MTCSPKSKIQGVRRSSAKFHVGIQGKHSNTVVFSGTEILEGRKHHYVKQKKYMYLYFSPMSEESTFIDWLKSKKKKKKDPWDVLRPVGQLEAAGVRQKPQGRSQGTWK